MRPEGHFALGWAAPAGGFGLQDSVVADGSGALGRSHHAGVSERWWPFGDIGLEAAASLYDDMVVLRAEPSCKLPIAFGLCVRPALGFQDAGGEALATGMLTVGIDLRYFSLWARGKLG